MCWIPQSSATVTINPQRLLTASEIEFDSSCLPNKNPQPYATLRKRHQEHSTALTFRH